MLLSFDGSDIDDAVAAVVCTAINAGNASHAGDTVSAGDVDTSACYVRDASDECVILEGATQWLVYFCQATGYLLTSRPVFFLRVPFANPDQGRSGLVRTWSGWLRTSRAWIWTRPGNATLCAAG